MTRGGGSCSPVGLEEDAAGAEITAWRGPEEDLPAALTSTPGSPGNRSTGRSAFTPAAETAGTLKIEGTILETAFFAAAVTFFFDPEEDFFFCPA